MSVTLLFTPNAVIDNSTTVAALQIRQLANAPASTSTGGAINLDNSGSTGAGLVIYSTQASPSGRLLAVRANNAAFSQSAAYFENNGTGHAMHAANTAASPNSTGCAANFTSTNSGNSAIFVSGVETSRGTVKITHTGTGSDASAAAISIDLAGSGTAAQGIFLDATGGGTTGDLMDLRNNGSQLFKVKSDGMVQFGNGGPKIIFGTGDPNTVVTAPVGSLFLRASGGTGAGVLWVKETGTGNSGWVQK